MNLLLFGAVLATVVQVGNAQCNLYGKVPADSACCKGAHTQHCCGVSANGPCFCSAYSSPPVCFGFHPVTATNVSQCCGKLKKRSWSSCFGLICTPRTDYTYWPTPFERNGWCKRNPSMAFNTPQAQMPNPLPGPCSCRKEATSCFSTTTTTTTTTTTKKPTTKTTTTTTTTTTKKPTTTPAPICPKPPTTAFGRMLGGTPVGDECKENGIISFRAGPTQVCNGVLGYNPNTKSNKIYITDFCINFLKAVLDAFSLPTFGVYNSAPFPVTAATIATAIGNDISAMDPPAGVLAASRCKTTACVYNAGTMSSIIDFNKCYISSYGYNFKIGDTAVNTGSLLRINVTKQATCTTTSASPNAQCFKAVDPKVKGCWGDNGAPVYCELSITKEKVLYGMVDAIGQPPKAITGVASTGVCSDSNEFHILPFK